MANRTISFTIHYPAESTESGNPTVILVHNFAGNEKTLKRHADLLTGLGYPCVTFDLAWHGENPRKPLPISLPNYWAKEITQVLDETSGEKIVFAFSGPGASALRALAKR